MYLFYICDLLLLSMLGGLAFPFLSFPRDKLLFLGFLLPFCGALPLLVRLGGVSQWSMVLWLFLPHLLQCLLYLFICANLWIREPDATALVCTLHWDSSLMTCAIIFCNSYLVMSLIDVRYCDARSWYDVGREEQNINVVMCQTRIGIGVTLRISHLAIGLILESEVTVIVD